MIYVILMYTNIKKIIKISYFMYKTALYKTALNNNV